MRLGYAVIENDSPIVGPAGMMNNNYVNDLRNNLSATIDELDKRQIIDRTRLAIGGHSYGAFSTVNAMVNTPFFKAGIAGDGAYNRTLTPLGFQTERRDLWTAPNVYLDMSPFLKANQLTGALLMYHGMADQNVGTDPINSTRLFHALNGLGKTVALLPLPGSRTGVARGRCSISGRAGRRGSTAVREESAAGDQTTRPATGGTTGRVLSRPTRGTNCGRRHGETHSSPCLFVFLRASSAIRVSSFRIAAFGYHSTPRLLPPVGHDSCRRFRRVVHDVRKSVRSRWVWSAPSVSAWRPA